jgi:hypothetical protein
MQNSKLKIQCSLVLFCIFNFAFLSSCSIPNLEKPQCAEARQTVREFYSYHLGNDMKPSKENLHLREKFLTDELRQNLTAQADDKIDYFTQTADYPKTFRVGDCEIVNENKTVFEVVLFWKDDTRSEQRKVSAEVVKQNDKWLINKIESE